MINVLHLPPQHRIIHEAMTHEYHHQVHKQLIVIELPSYDKQLSALEYIKTYLAVTVTVRQCITSCSRMGTYVCKFMIILSTSDTIALGRGYADTHTLRC